VTRRFGKHNIIGSETHLPRPMVYLRQGAISRRSRPGPRIALAVSLAALAAALTYGWLAA
jgi:hypothetical protein